MWLTSKAQTLLILVLLGLYSLNSFSAGLDIKTNGKQYELKSAQLELLSEKLSFNSKESMQFVLASLINEIKSELNKEGKSLDLENLLNLAGSNKMPAQEKMNTKGVSTYQTYLSVFNNESRTTFLSSFYEYYFRNYHEFSEINIQASNLLEYKKLTFVVLERLILKDLYLTFNDAVNELLDRNSERGLDPIKLPRKVFEKTFGLNNDDSVPVLADFLSPYTFEMRRELLRPELINQNKLYKSLRGLIGEFNHAQFYSLIFSKFKNENKIKFKELISGLRNKVEAEFVDFEKHFLYPKILNDKLSHTVSDYIRSPNNKLNSTLFISTLVCGLSNNLKAQGNNHYQELMSYCHFNNIHSAFVMKESDALLNLKKNNIMNHYPQLSLLLSTNRSLSSQK